MGVDMSINESTRNTVYSFAAALVNEPLEELTNDDILWPYFRRGKLSGRSSSKDRGSLFLIGEDFLEFERCLDALVDESDLEHGRETAVKDEVESAEMPENVSAID